MRKLVTKFLIGIIILAAISIATSISLSGLEKKERDELYRQVELFSDTLAIIKSDYVEEIKPRDLIYGALKGMLYSLDPHSQFMDPETYRELKVETEGRFGGLGIEITIKDGILTVITPLEDTPAWKAGVKAQDRIVKIDGELTKDITITEAVKKLRGKPGTEVNITILREGEKELLDFRIVRGLIKIKDIKEAKILQDGIAYIRITEFREGTSKQLAVALDSLKKEGMEGLIVDLRNNPGGLLDSVVNAVGEFVERGKLIVATKGRKASQNMEFISKQAHPILDLPIVVLVNEGSASGSEIFAAALQDYRRAIIMGTKTFGKGSVQTVIPLSDGSALRLTTSKYMTPKGRFIHDEGIIPDVTVEQAKIAVEEGAEKETVDIFKELESKQDLPKQDWSKDYKDDYQLLRAVDLLKAIKIYQDFGNKNSK